MALFYVSVTPAQLAAIQAVNINQVNKNKQIQPLQLTNGSYILNADIASDLVTWAPWASILSQLQLVIVDSSLFPVATWTVFNLYYLTDQSGDINGSCTLAASFNSLAAAQAQAATDSVAHFSVQEFSNTTTGGTIVYIV